ncbi:MAG: hypothetical protein DCC75_02910 [Proteobacteria bacterium]|nr:MAG: hypothetical protein DCC75_02910 [Pseudomonadota bacterium]
MKKDKVEKFMRLAGQEVAERLRTGNEAERKLGAQLLLSEVLEYVIHGLGVVPEVNGVRIHEPDEVHYHAENDPDPLEMLDGLADVAYTMYWNANAFGLPLDQAYDMVCDNNLDKFVKLGAWADGMAELQREQWSCRQEITWPPEVVRVEVLSVDGELYAAGKDARGKVRKPSSYSQVDLSKLISG